MQSRHWQHSSWCRHWPIWCRLPDLVIPTGIERWAICIIISIVIVALNVIWFVTRKDVSSLSATAPSGDVIGNRVVVGGDNEVSNLFGHNNIVDADADEQLKSGTAAARGDVRDNSVEIDGDNKRPNVFGHGNVVGASAGKSPKS